MYLVTFCPCLLLKTVCVFVWRLIVPVGVFDLQESNWAAAVNQRPHLSLSLSPSLPSSLSPLLSLSVCPSLTLSVSLPFLFEAELYLIPSFPPPQRLNTPSHPVLPFVSLSLFLPHLLPLFHSISHHPPPSANQPPSRELWIEFKSVELYCLPPPLYLPPPRLPLLSNFLRLFGIDYSRDLPPTPRSLLYINPFLFPPSCLLPAARWASALSQRFGGEKHHLLHVVMKLKWW